MKKRILLLVMIVFLTLTGCSKYQEDNFIDELIKAEYHLTEIDSIIDTFEFSSVKSINDPYSEDIGIIYELDIGLEEFYQNRLENSYFVNDIVFVYKIDNYVIEMNHSLYSTFPGFIRHYDFEANYQYHLHFSGNIDYHPVLNQLFDNGTLIHEINTEEEILQYRSNYTDSLVDINDIISCINDGSSEYDYTMVVVVTDSLESATTVYQDMDDYVVYGNVIYHYVQYQNLVFRISTNLLVESESITQFLFSDITLVFYNSKDRFETE